LVKYAAISITVEVKKCLELMKGNKTWSEFLTETVIEPQSLKSKNAPKNSEKIL
jgi:predicted CopG family antitoxin